MPHRYPAEVRYQVIELARSGTKVAQLSATFGISDATIYNWLKQERIDRGESPGLSTEEALDLAAAKRRIKQLETDLDVGGCLDAREGNSHRPGSAALPGRCRCGIRCGRCSRPRQRDSRLAHRPGGHRPPLGRLSPALGRARHRRLDRGRGTRSWSAGLAPGGLSRHLHLSRGDRGAVHGRRLEGTRIGALR